MKIINHLAFLLLFVAISLPTALRAQSALCFPHFVGNDKIQVLNDIEAWYHSNFNNTAGFYSTENAMSLIRPFIFNLPTPITFNHDCDQGKLLATGRTFLSPYQHVFRWENEGNSSLTYNSSVLDLRKSPQSTQSDPSIIGGAFIEGTDPNVGKLMAFNVTCPTTGESNFYVIIIDKDIGIAFLNDICYPAEVTLGTNTSSPLALPLPKLQLTETNVSLFPNPTIDGQVQVNLDIAKETRASLQVYSASSGKLIHSIFNQQNLRPGNQQHALASDQLSAGLYYVVLQTEEKRIVKKLTKL